MRQASNAMMREALTGLGPRTRKALMDRRTRPAISGTERAFFRSQVPQNPLQILEIARQDASRFGMQNVGYTLTRERVVLATDDGRVSIDIPLNQEIDSSESQALACLAVLRVLHELYGS